MSVATRVDVELNAVNMILIWFTGPALSGDGHAYRDLLFRGAVSWYTVSFGTVSVKTATETCVLRPRTAKVMLRTWTVYGSDSTCLNMSIACFG